MKKNKPVAHWISSNDPLSTSWTPALKAPNNRNPNNRSLFLTNALVSSTPLSIDSRTLSSLCYLIKDRNSTPMVTSVEWCHWPTNFYSLKHSLSPEGSQSVVSQSLNNSVRFQEKQIREHFYQLWHTILISWNHQFFTPCTISKPVVSSQSTAITCEFSQSFEHPNKLSRWQIHRMFFCRVEP